MDTSPENTSPVRPISSIPIRAVPSSDVSNRESTVIDCADCSMYETDHCSDCVVSYFCGPIGEEDSASTAVVFDLDEMRAVRLLAEAGLVPTLRHSAAG